MRIVYIVFLLILVITMPASSLRGEVPGAGGGTEVPPDQAGMIFVNGSCFDMGDVFKNGDLMRNLFIRFA